MTLNVSEAVRKVCLSFPDVVEKEAHSMLDFRVNGKTFATYAVNHHGDGRVALWLEAEPGSQTHFTEMEPDHYFVPPYVGPKGWLGVILDQGLSWDSIASRVREAYEKVAKAEQRSQIGKTIEIRVPVRELSSEEKDPLQNPAIQKKLKVLNKYCSVLPEATEACQFGNPVWKAGKKTFVCVHRYNQRLCLQVWVGIDQQSFLTLDQRYSIPAYVGHNGWIDLDIEENVNWAEIESLVLSSYRHFALKRMLKQLD